MKGMAERNARAQMCRVQAAWPNGPRHSPCQHHVHPKWHCLSANHYLADKPPLTYRRYSHQVRLRGEELLPTPVSRRLPPRVVQVHRPAGDLQLEGRETVSNPSVAPGQCRRRQVCSHCIRRAICPLGQCQVFHHQRHLKEPILSREVDQRPPTMIPHYWWQNFTVQGGRRTLSMSSGSTTNTMLSPLRRQSG